MNEEEKYQAQLVALATEFKFLLFQNAPKRDDDAYPHTIKRNGIIISPFPRNLKQNGTQLIDNSEGVVVKHGYEPARYALYANKRSRKPAYIEKSQRQFLAYLEGEGWEAE